MGTYLSTPAAEKYKEWGEDLNCPVRPMRWAVVDMQGWRKSMEDAHCVETTVPYPPGGLHYLKDKDKDKIPKAKVFGVFDGHGGPEVARFCQLYLVSVLMQQKVWQDQVENGANEGDKATSSSQEDPSKSGIGQALIASFHALDRMIDDPERRDEIIRLRTHKAPPTERRDAGTIPPEKPVQPRETEIPKVMNLAQDANAVNVLPPPPPPPPTQIPTSNTTTTEVENETNNTAEDEAKPEAQSTSELDEKEEESNVPESTASSVSSTDEQSASSMDQTQKTTDESMPTEEGETTEKETQNEHDEKENLKAAFESSDSENSEDYDSDEAVGTEEAAKEREQEADDDDDSKDDDVNINPYEGGIQVVESAGIEEGVTEPAAVPANKVTVMFQRLLNMNENQQSGQMVVSIADPDEPVDVKSQNSNPAQQYQISAPTGPSAAIPSIFQNGRLICNLPDHPIHAGCTAVVAVLLGMTLTVANAGDSRAVLCREGGVTEPLSFDHKPQQPREMNRISNAGGFVNRFGRVNGNLNLSRSIGDLKYKQVPGIAPKDQMITAEPDILQVTLNPKDEFIILGCDGIWDCLTNEKCVEFVRERIDTKEPTDIGEEMLNTILSDDPRATQGIGGDNMTVLIIDLQPQSRSYTVDPAWGPPTSAAL